MGEIWYGGTIYTMREENEKWTLFTLKTVRSLMLEVKKS